MFSFDNKIPRSVDRHGGEKKEETNFQGIMVPANTRFSPATEGSWLVINGIKKIMMKEGERICFSINLEPATFVTCDIEEKPGLIPTRG